MKKHTQVDKHNSVRLGIFFVIVVAITISIAVLYRTFQMYQKSIYESDQPFTIHISSRNSAQELVFFNPVDNKIVRFSTKKVVANESLTKSVGVPVDARVYTNTITITDTITQQLKTLFFRLPDAKTTLTLIDLSRLYFLTKTIADSDIETIYIDEVDDGFDIDEKVEDKFTDNLMQEDNKTVQIINASGISGMGSRVEKTINRLGAAVIDVQTARNEEAITKIEYVSEETYTINKMKKLFSVPVRKVDGQRISDIIITLGKNNPQLVE